mmetsp:Transcript_13947/g.22070  ORF Transcript_13947/g.22070 Transcript_13947/m.22070 type:complete len:406 (-) Transcript_13947:182-1399(-)
MMERGSRFDFKNIEEIVDLSDSEGENKNTWEREIERTWEAVPENRKGELKNVKFLERQQRKRLKRSQEVAQVEKGMVRYLNLVIDFSEAMNERDLKPTRKLAASRIACNFIKEFFNQNPISQMGIIVGYDKYAKKVTDLSGNPNQQIKKLNQVTEDLLHHGGEFSLQNSLEAAKGSLQHIPPYGSREVLIVMGALRTCDHGDIFETIEEIKKHKIRVSVISLSAQTYICNQITKSTNGRYDVSMSRSHFETVFLEHVKPYTIHSSQKIQRKWIRMGFPKKQTNNYPSLCQCHNEFSYSGYVCPKCKTKSCELPTDCQVCARTMVSSSHLARCYHHLLPVPPFQELPAVESKRGRWTGECFGCQLKLDTEDRLVTICPKCKRYFCVPCDVYIHDSLHNCPGCLSTT